MGIRYGCVKPACHAKLYINAQHELSSIEIKEGHTCCKDGHQSLEKRLMRLKCQENASQTGAGTAKFIFEETAKQNPGFCTSTSFAHVKQTILRAKRGQRSQVKYEYSSLKDLNDHIEQTPDLLHRSSYLGHLETALIRSSSKSLQFIIYNSKLISIFDNHNDIFIDATYKTRPKVKGVHQLLTVMAKKYDIVVPCMWILMSRKTTAAYASVWKFVKDNIPTFKPLRCHCDFEKALMKSVKENFEGISVKGCYFHYCQAILRKAKSPIYKLYVQDNKEKNPEGEQIIKSIMALPLLPKEKCDEALKIILDDIHGSFTNTPVIKKKWLKFINAYFTSEWMQRVTPKVFSVFYENDRTNNYIESYHRSLAASIRPQPSCPVFFDGILNLVTKSYEDMERAKARLQVTKSATRETLLRNSRIQSVWNDILAHPQWPTSKFLRDLTQYEDDAPEIIENDDTSDASSVAEDDSDFEDEDVDFVEFKFDEDSVSASRRLGRSSVKERWQITAIAARLYPVLLLESLFPSSCGANLGDISCYS